MKFKELMVSHTFDVCESNDKVYHYEDGSETNEKILYILFEKAITFEGLTEDFAVMSRHVANKFKSCTNYEEKKRFLENCEFSRNNKDGNSQFAITMGINRLFRFEPQQRIDKNKLKNSLWNLKKEKYECHYDYIVIDINTFMAYGEKYHYDHEYNNWGDETDEWIVEVEDNKPKYLFEKHILNYIDDFVDSIDTLLNYRDRANIVYHQLLSYAQDIAQKYEYENSKYAQIVWNIKEGKIQKKIFINEYDYEEKCIESQPKEGIFSLYAGDFLEEQCGYDNKGYEHLEEYKLNNQKIRLFVYNAIATYNDFDDCGLSYPDAFLDYYSLL